MGCGTQHRNGLRINGKILNLSMKTPFNQVGGASTESPRCKRESSGVHKGGLRMVKRER